MLAQHVSHVYLRRASELVDEQEPEKASICARAAQAEVDDPETVIGEFCDCSACLAYLTSARLRRTLP
jgi:hypothetical protein